MGGFRPGLSDLDLVAVLDSAPNRSCQASLRVLHVELRRSEAAAEKLHCVSVPRRALTEPAATHVTWAHARLLRRRLDAIARARAAAGGITAGLEPSAFPFPWSQRSPRDTGARRSTSPSGDGCGGPSPLADWSRVASPRFFRSTPSH